jgi:pyrrolidone-carboxylate peptidase
MADQEQQIQQSESDSVQEAVSQKKESKKRLRSNEKKENLKSVYADLTVKELKEKLSQRGIPTSVSKMNRDLLVALHVYHDIQASNASKKKAKTETSESAEEEAVESK